MASRPVLLSVAADRKASGGETINAGTYPGTENDVPDVNAPAGLGKPRYVIEHPEETLIDVTDLVEIGDIIVVVED